MPRPEMPPIIKGMLLVASGVRRTEEVRVAGIGAKWVTVVPPTVYEAFLADRAGNARYARRFLLEDMREGEPGERYGHASVLASREQVAYDARRLAASRYLEQTLGLTVTGRQSPLSDPDRLMSFVAFLRASSIEHLLLPPVPPEAGPDGR
jgi:hypothetical protein